MTINIHFQLFRLFTQTKCVSKHARCVGRYVITGKFSRIHRFPISRSARGGSTNNDDDDSNNDNNDDNERDF